MIIKQIYIWTLGIFLTYLFILIGLNITGPDYKSYTNAAELSVTQNFFKLREILSWSIIDLFTRIDSNIDYFGLKIFSSVLFSLLFFYSFQLIKEEIINKKFNHESLSGVKIILFVLTFFVCLTPYVNLLALSALRQGLALVFLVIMIISMTKNKFLFSLFFFSLAFICHNSALIFLPLFVLQLFKSYKFRFLLISSALVIYLFLSFMIPFQPSVDSDNRIIYGVFSILCLSIFIIKRKNFSECDLLLITGIFLTLPFFNLESYYDRLGLYAAFFGSILVSKKIITTGPRTISFIIAVMALLFSFLIVASITYPPLIT